MPILLGFGKTLMVHFTFIIQVDYKMILFNRTMVKLVSILIILQINYIYEQLPVLMEL